MANKKGGDKMDDYQERVIEEKKQLDDKLNKLRAFNRSRTVDITGDERERLARQEYIMLLYAQVLNERIRAF